MTPPVQVTVTWGRLNPRGPSAWDAAAADYRKKHGQDFEKLDSAAQLAYLRQFTSR